MCTGTTEDGGMAGASIPLSFQKGRNGGDFYHRLMSRQIFGVVKGCGFLPEFPQTSAKSFCATFDYTFSPTKIIKTFSGMSKRSSWVFLQTLGAIF